MVWWGIALSEFFGTFFLVLLGLGINAGVSLQKTHIKNGDWLVNSFGWAFGVFVGASIAYYSGGHINPAVSLAFWATEQITFVQFLDYIVFQFLGAFLAALVIIFLYWNHFKETEDKTKIAGTFYTMPAIKNSYFNFATEAVATFVLVSAVLASIWYDIPFYGPLFAALVVFAIALSLGGLTGYAINPARDLMPRLAHFLFAVPNKGKTDWSYSWIPVVGPLTGSLFSVGLVWAIIAIVGDGNPFIS